MKKSAFITAALVAMGTALPATAQNQTPPPSVCDTDPGFRAFDFWVGDWRVTSSKTGVFQGTNKISYVEGGCALLEEWTGATGGTGQSINYYNPNTGMWRQVWVSEGAGGYSIDYDGGLEYGSMKLEGTIYYYKQGTTFPFRGTWTPNPDGTVRQFFEQYDPEKKEWTVWFDGLYAREEKSE